MSLIRDAYARFRLLLHEVAKFGIVGGIGFVVQMGVTNLLRFGMGFGSTTSVVLAYSLATVVTFVGNKFWTYRHRVGNNHVAKETLVFLALNGVGLLIQVGVVDFVTDGLGYHNDKFAYNVANVIGIGLGTIFRLFAYRRWVFLATPAAPASVESLEPELSAAGYGYQPERGAQHLGGLGNGQVSNGYHSADHMFQPGPGGSGVQNGVVNTRRVHRAGQHRRLPN